jgi:hypothetical protein
VNDEDKELRFDSSPGALGSVAPARTSAPRPALRRVKRRVWSGNGPATRPWLPGLQFIFWPPGCAKIY